MTLLWVLVVCVWLPVATLHSATCNATLAISPQSGPVGTVVRITGRGFTAACDLTRGTNGDGLILQSAGGTSTFGYAPIADPGRKPPIGADDTFQLTYAIPATLQPYHSVGGGPVVPGPYYFHTTPPTSKVPASAAEGEMEFARVRFVVTGPAALPATGAGGIAVGGKGAFSFLIALTVGVVLVSRTGTIRGKSQRRWRDSTFGQVCEHMETLAITANCSHHLPPTACKTRDGLRTVLRGPSRTLQTVLAVSPPRRGLLC